MRTTILLLAACVALAASDVDTRELNQRPWAPTVPRDYTHDALTPADWVGPDGIIYPLWIWAGVHEGQPGARVPGIPRRDDVVATLPAELAGPEQGAAFTAALEAAIAQAGTTGGGVIRIAPGVFDLVRPLIIAHDRVVIRGSGRGKAAETGGRNDAQETRLRFIFGYDAAAGPVTAALAFPQHGQLTRDSRLCLYAPAFSPKADGESRQGGGKSSHIHGLYATISVPGRKDVTYAISRDGGDRAMHDRWQHFGISGPTDSASLTGEALADLLADAPSASVRVAVEWRWKQKQGKTEVAMVDRAEGPATSFVCAFGSRTGEPVKPAVDTVGEALLFTAPAGDQPTGRAYLLRDAKRGDTALLLSHPDVATAEAAGLRPGAMVRIFSYTTQAWADAIERDGGGGVPRDQPATVLAVEPADGGVLLRIEQPLQLDYAATGEQVDTWNPAIKGYSRTGTRPSWVQATQPVQGCAVEDLVLEQTRRIWFNGIAFSTAMNCWVRNVRIERVGRDPLRINGIMNEVRDCELLDPLWANNTGGGSGYLHGGSFGLYDNIYTRNLRHSPNVSGNTGCVFRNSRFFSSDMQWHQNWGVAHLFENCTVDGLTGTGSYGYGAFAQRSLADIHGPGMGPRNCIYNCDLIGSKGGIFLGGKSEYPLILHNRVRAWSGPGLILRYHVFDGIILGNVFVVQDRLEPAVLFGENEPDKSRLPRGADGKAPPLHPLLGTANPGNDFIDNTLYGGSGDFADGAPAFGQVKSEWRRSHGNRALPWTADPPRPQPAMASVFETQRAHPAGFPPQDPSQALFLRPGPPDRSARADGTLVAQINFRDKRGDRGDQSEHWRYETPGAGWLNDLGEAFAEHPDTDFSYGWTGGAPRVYQEAIWAHSDFRYRTLAAWVSDDELRPVSEWDSKGDLAWQIRLEPGAYQVFLACGSPRKPERFSWPDETPLPFNQRNDWLLNDVALHDPQQPDVRLDAFWSAVTVGADGLLVLRPAPTAITPRVAFVQIYRTP